MGEKDSTIIAIDPRYQAVARSGSQARIHFVLEKFPKRGLTLSEVAELTGLKESSTYVALRDLFRAQVVKETRTQQTRIYQLIPKADIAVKGLEKSKRSISE